MTTENKLVPGSRWQHSKRGTQYEIVGTALLQDAAGGGIHEGHPLTIYRGEDGKLWARSSAEFADGRFNAAPSAPASQPQGEVERHIREAYAQGFRDGETGDFNPDTYLARCASLTPPDRAAGDNAIIERARPGKIDPCEYCFGVTRHDADCRALQQRTDAGEKAQGMDAKAPDFSAFSGVEKLARLMEWHHFGLTWEHMERVPRQEVTAACQAAFDW